MFKQNIKLLLLLFFVVIWSCQPINAQTHSADLKPDAVLKKGIDDIISIINKTLNDEGKQQKDRDEVLFAKAEELFDFRALSMGALSRNWRRFSESERSEFIKYFSKLIVQTYVSKIDDSSFKDIDIRYLKMEMLASTKSGIERADIFSEVTQNNVVTPVDYKMMKEPESQWKIYDVKIEGVSLVGNYREQYRTRFMDTPEELIQEIREKMAQ